MDVISCFCRSSKRLLHDSGLLTALAASFLSLSPSVRAQTFSPCDLGQYGVVNGADVTLAINMALGIIPCTANVEGPLTCTVITVQRVFNASNGQACVVYNTHATTLSWTASTTPNVSYNVYRATSSSGPFTTPLNASPISVTTYIDTSVQAGQKYYYVATAVASNGSQSADSSPAAQATIPSP